MAWLHGFRQRLRDHLPGRDRAFAEEVRFHLEIETARLRAAGLDEDEASTAALARFGDPYRVHESMRDVRGRPLLEGGMQDVRWSIRTLRKHLGFTTLALATLVLGIGAATVAFTVLHTVLLRPLPFPAANELVLIRERTEQQQLRPPSHPNFLDWRERARVFDGVASAMFPGNWSVDTDVAEPMRVVAVGVSHGFFEVLGVQPVIGRSFLESESAVSAPRVAMVSHDFWLQAMGGRQPLGTIRSGSTTRDVVGVLPQGFRFLEEADVYWPHEQAPGTFRTAHNYRVIGRLAPDRTLDDARSEMTRLSKALHTEYGTGTQAVDADVTPLREYIVGDHRMLLAVIFGAAVLVLLIACTNLASAQLARGFGRMREVAVRSALGASRGRLVRQLLIESGVLAGAGALLGTAVALAITRVVRTVGQGLVPRLEELAVDARVLAFVGMVTIATTLLIGLYPALRLARGDPSDALRAARGSAHTARAGVWRALIGAEVAMAVVLLVGSVLLVRTLHNILTADTGFDPRGVATAAISLGDGPLGRLESIRAELAAIPGVAGAAFTTMLPLQWGSASAPVLRPGDPADRDWPAFAGFRVITPEYFEVLHQPILSGRGFTTADRAGTVPVAVITPGIAERLWPGQDPLGEQIRTTYLADQWLTVVGVAQEASSWTMPRGSQNEIYVPLAQQRDAARWQLVAVVRAERDVRAVVAPMRTTLRSVAPDAPAEIGLLEDRIARSAADRRFAMLALAAFGIVALLLASIGIYGVLSYSVAARTRSIGVRMALGASPGAIRRSVLRDAAVMAAVGIALGLLASLGATRYLASALYGVAPLDPLSYGIGAAVLFGAALFGAYVPAWRSSRVNPLVVMQSD